MAIQGVDSFGPYLDTGTNTTPTPRAYTEEEVHLPSELDTSSKNTIAQTVASHVAHRPKSGPR